MERKRLNLPNTNGFVGAGLRARPRDPVNFILLLVPVAQTLAWPSVLKINTENTETQKRNTKNTKKSVHK